MARYTLEWRQFGGADVKPVFLHRLLYVDGARAAKHAAEHLVDAAWHREFRLERAGRDVFTDLHRILDWDPSASPLPAGAPDHIWRRDLERDLVADRFLATILDSTVPALGAGVLRRADADTLVRFARAAVLRPRL